MEKIGCRIRTSNTASSRCKIELGLYRKVLIMPVSAHYTGFDESNKEETFEDWIERNVQAANPALRFYPMPECDGCEDNTEDPVVYTSEYGKNTPLRDGNFAFTQKFERDSCLNRRLIAFNNQTFRAIIFDNENRAQIIRTSKGITGELYNIYVTQPKANTASELSQPTIKYSAVNSNEHQLREIIPTNLDWGQINGLEDVSLNVVKDGTNYLITFSVACSGDDVTGEFAALSGSLNAWLVQVGNNAPQPATVAPTYDAAKGAFIVPVSIAASGNSLLGIVNPQKLYDLGISGKECPEMSLLPS